MSVPAKFLTLSIREQLCITILILTIFSVIVILALPGSFSYEILMEDYKKKKKFFFNEYKEYIEACFYFQSFTILKYEEIIKRMSKQSFKYWQKEHIFNTTSDFKEGFNNTYPIQDVFENNDEDSNILYYYCYNTPEFCKTFKELAIEPLHDKYESLNNLIFSHDIDKRFTIPGFDMPIISSYIGININDSIMYGFGKEGIYKAIVNTNDYSNINTRYLKAYYDTVKTKILQASSGKYDTYYSVNLFLFKELFTKIISEMAQVEERDYLDPNNPETILDYNRAMSGYYSSIDLANDKSFFLTFGKEEKSYYYFEFNLIKNYLEVIGDILSSELNMDFIPLYSFNHTIISPGLCAKFLMKQSKDMFNEKALNESYNNIHKGSSKIYDCIYDKNNLKIDKVMEMLETNITHFLGKSNKIYQGLIELDEPYYFMKYSFPNVNPLKEFLSDYLLIDHLDFYLFAPFKEPIEYSEYIKTQYKNLFYLMVILILYIWIICFVINMIIYIKVSKQITDPIYKLQEAIENSNLKDESVFVYEYDDIINELFITCKELLTGNIDSSNSMKYSGQFNILNNQKDNDDKVIDKNKYEKNLIINNEIVNQLINEQQNMMNFGNDIDINDDGNINNTSEKEVRDSHRKKTNKSKHKSNHEDKKDNNKEKENNEEKDKLAKMQEEEEKDKRPYKSLFKLAQYLYYYRCKVEENIINININTNEDDKKSNVSKINERNATPNRNQKHKKSLSKSGINEKSEDNNMNVNVLRGKDLTYLWYMEMKKKNNKSFNYEIGDDYEELFKD